ncbi:putative ABC transport system ATP-binding protein [Methanolinea mesophila]|uniref:ABC transporter ATP-binding protein n=1 Tax=Methanolinea mesophila TaxID=547055 RepID=UPI001AE111DB|nr:putative ABC transport system ATP-binding protein [Methanolinea mesophila]
MIEVRDVSKIYRTGGGEVRAVDRANFVIRPGDFALILGRSGSGKSTLLGMLAGIIRPTLGTVLVRGEDLASLSDDQISGLRAREIGFVFQFSGLLPTVTVRENVLVPTLFCRGGPGCGDRAAEILELVGLTSRVDAYPRTLSSGEMKRAAIARALINGPSILIADEPTGDLDARTEYEIMEIFRELNREGTTIVMVTHNPDLVAYGTRVFDMEQGVITERSGGAGHAG